MSPTHRRLCAGCKREIVTPPRSRCPGCEIAHERARGSRQRRGYDAGYQRIRVYVLGRDRFICRYCGGPADTTDHVVPLSRGGRSTIENLVAACSSCNVRKGGR